MNTTIKIGEKYHLLSNDKKTLCGLKAIGQVKEGPVPFGTLCDKCKEIRALRERNW